MQDGRRYDNKTEMLKHQMRSGPNYYISWGIDPLGVITRIYWCINTIMKRMGWKLEEWMRDPMRWLPLLQEAMLWLHDP